MNQHDCFGYLCLAFLTRFHARCHGCVFPGREATKDVQVKHVVGRLGGGWSHSPVHMVAPYCSMEMVGIQRPRTSVSSGRMAEGQIG
jgi:hypothetical protein